jgi:hemerythrin superfamily protein
MTDVRLQLTKDHAELDALLRCLSEDTVAPECGALQATWSQFETRLLAHMDAEERYLLPLVEVSQPAEAAHTRMDHARIRQLVSELGVAIELHTARQPAIEELIAMLRKHAAHEETVLYQLGNERAPAPIQDAISAALKAAARLTVAT